MLFFVDRNPQQTYCPDTRGRLGLESIDGKVVHGFISSPAFLALDGQSLWSRVVFQEMNKVMGREDVRGRKVQTDKSLEPDM